MDALHPGGQAGWIDTHCHLDAAEFEPDRAQVIARARAAGVALMVIPAVMPAHFAAVQDAARACEGAYALGTHPLYIDLVDARAPEQLAAALAAAVADPRLVAVGEIGIDLFVPSLKTPQGRARQEALYAAQLDVAAAGGWPVILHVRRSADVLLKHLRACRSRGRPVPGGIAHAFNGSEQQARAFLDLGFRLGFGGALTFERAQQIRRLAVWLPDDAIVLETDAPDIPPHWLYRTAEERARGAISRNEPCELPRVARVLADLRGVDPDTLREQTSRNALTALPRLQGLSADRTTRHRIGV